MIKSVSILKDEDSEHPIPTSWRQTLIDVVDAFKDGDFRLGRGIEGVKPVSEQVATAIARNIDAYGDQLTSLPDNTWQTSVYRWMRDYWDVLVDLYTVGEGDSDLVLFIRVEEDGPQYRFEILTVHVP